MQYHCFPPPKSEGRCHQNQTTGIQVTCEASSSVWDPHTKKDTSGIETVHRRAARFVLRDYRRIASADDMVGRLNWPILEYRRYVARLATFYEVVNRLNCCCQEPRVSTSGHQIEKSIVQELCESRGGRPGLSVLTSLLVCSVA